jgi:hypothetical protein
MAMIPRREVTGTQLPARWRWRPQRRPRRHRDPEPGRRPPSHHQRDQGRAKDLDREHEIDTAGGDGRTRHVKAFGGGLVLDQHPPPGALDRPDPGGAVAEPTTDHHRDQPRTGGGRGRASRGSANGQAPSGSTRVKLPSGSTAAAGRPGPPPEHPAGAAPPPGPARRPARSHRPTARQARPADRRHGAAPPPPPRPGTPAQPRQDALASGQATLGSSYHHHHIEHDPATYTSDHTNHPTATDNSRTGRLRRGSSKGALCCRYWIAADCQGSADRRWAGRPRTCDPAVMSRLL